MVGDLVKAVVIGLGTFGGMLIYWRLARVQLARGPVLHSAIAGAVATALTLVAGWLQ